MPFVAMMMGYSYNEKSSECPILTVEGGQIPGVIVGYEANGATTTYYEYNGIP